MSSSASERELLRRIRARDEAAWQECIACYSGRLQAFASRRLGNEATAEDVVQETFLGFLNALPNYDETTPLESFLFAIASHKLTDVLRRQGRRPALPLLRNADSGSSMEPAGNGRVASSIARSREGRQHEAVVIAACLRTLIQQWFDRSEFTRMMCAELLFVQGLPNKDVANRLRISEQDVANHKQFILSRLKAASPGLEFDDGFLKTGF